MSLMGSLPTLKSFRVDDSQTAYQLQDKQIIKRMSEPLEITNQAFNLLSPSAYETVAQLELPPEDLEYIRSNEVAIDLNFKFQLEWWNANEYQVMRHPQIIQSLRSANIIKNPRQVVMRLNWPSSHLTPDRPFAHMISFSYNAEFNLILKHQLNSDLSDWEIKAIANEPQGAPQNYRIRLTNLSLSYPVPTIFYRLQTQFLEVPNFYSRHNETQWWSEFNQLLLESDLLNVDNFDNFFQRPEPNDLAPDFVAQIPHGEAGYLNLNLHFKDYNYLKIYQYFFPSPKIRIIFHQYLDLAQEFDHTTLIVEPDQDYWITFKYQHLEWSWWLNHHVEAVIKENALILKPKNHNLVHGEAKVVIIERKSALDELGLQASFDYLQVGDLDNLSLEIFNLFKNKNLTIFAEENFENYQIMEVTDGKQFVLKALHQAKYSGSLNLKFKAIETARRSPAPRQNDAKNKLYWPIWNWALLVFSILSVLVLVSLKFIKSKPTKK